MHRRDALQFLGLASLAALTPGAFSAPPAAESPVASGKSDSIKNPISLAQWSLHRRFGLCKPEERPATVADPMDFAKIAKGEFGLSLVEYVNSF